MKINTKEFIKNLKGDNSDLTIGDAIGGILIASEAGGKMKMYVLAQKFANDDVVEVDSADLSLIKQSVEATKVYTNLVSGQLLVLLEGNK